MIIIGIAGISLSAIFVRIFPGTVCGHSPLPPDVDRGIDDACGFGTEGLQAELRETDRKTVLLCGASGSVPGPAFYGMVRVAEPDFSGQFHSHCVHGGYMGGAGILSVHEGKISVPAGVGILVTVGGSLLIAFSDYSAGGNHLYGDVLAPCCGCILRRIHP